MKVLILVVVAVTGCASYGTLTSARPVAPGASQVTTSLEVDGVGVVENPLRVPLPSMTVDVRRGVREDVDVGAKIGMLPLGPIGNGLAGEAQLRWRFLGDDDGRVEAAIAPAAGWRGISSSGARWDAAHVVLPVIVGVNLGRHQLYVTTKAGWQRWWSVGAMPVDVPFAGAGVGFAWRLRRNTSLITELTALRSPTSVDNSEGAGIVNFGVGLVFDGR